MTTKDQVSRMTWIGLPGCIYIKPISDTSVYVIKPQDLTKYQLSRHHTTTADTELIGTYPDPHTAMYAVRKWEIQHGG